MTQGFDDAHWRDVADSVRGDVSDIRNQLAKFGKAQDSGNADYDSFNFQIPSNSVILLLGFDLSRIRSYIMASETGVFMGKRDALNAATIDTLQGFPVAITSPGIEYKSVQPLYCVFPAASPTATRYVSIHVERSANPN